MKAGVTAAVGCLAFVALAAGGYRYYKLSPQYAFAEIKRAVEDHDKDRFVEFVDLDTLISHGVDDFMSVQHQKDSGLANTFAAGLVALMKPRLVEVVKDQVGRLVESGALPPSEAGAEPEVNLAGFFGAAQSKSTFKSAKKEGKITTVGFEIVHAKYDVPVEVYVRLREHDGHLRVTEIANLADVFQKVSRAEVDWKTAKNKPARDALDSTLLAGPFRGQKRTDEWNINRDVDLQLRLKNTGTKSVKAWSGDLVLLGRGDVEVASLPLRAESSAVLPPQAEASFSWDIRINQFVDKDVALWTADFSELRSELHLRTVTFEGGEDLRLPYPDLKPGVQ